MCKIDDKAEKQINAIRKIKETDAAIKKGSRKGIDRQELAASTGMTEDELQALLSMYSSLDPYAVNINVFKKLRGTDLKETIFYYTPSICRYGVEYLFGRLNGALPDLDDVIAENSRRYTASKHGPIAPEYITKEALIRALEEFGKEYLTVLRGAEADGYDWKVIAEAVGLPVTEETVNRLETLSAES